MEAKNIIPSERGRAANGIRTAALIVILCAVALMADHTFFVAPHARAAAEPPAAVRPTSVPIDGLAMPEALRPTAVDANVPPPTAL